MNNKKTLILGLLILGLFVLVGYLGVHQIYHADEHTWLQVIEPTTNFTSPHPPMMKTVMRYAGSIVGFGNLRYPIFIFGLLNLILLFLIVKKSSKNKTIALIASFLLTLNVYNAIASLQIDIDGALLPFFVLLSYYCYISWLESDRKHLWLAFLILALIGGFLTKLTFVLFFGTLIVEYVWQRGFFKNKSLGLLLRQALTVAGPFLFVVFVVLAGYKFGKFNSPVADHGLQFKIFNFASRAYLDLIFKVLKSIVWLSPLLLLPTLGGLFIKKIRHGQRFWYLYLIFSFLFYTVLFDFATFDVQRYLMFMIAPACIIAADVLYYLTDNWSWRKNWLPVSGGILAFSASAYFVLSRAYAILPLDPKINYLKQLRHLHLNFLIPFNGGSGPIGFYFSAMFIALSWLAAIFLLWLAFYKKNYRQAVISVFIVFGLGYNILMTNEFLRGSLYGSPAALARQTVDYVNTNPTIKQVITYNNTGVYDLLASGKWSSRFYTSPTRDYVNKLNSFRGHYMIVDFPLIEKPGRYWPLITRCPDIKEFQNGVIKAYVFDCTKLALNLKNKK